MKYTPKTLQTLPNADEIDSLFRIAASVDLALARAGFGSWESDSPRKSSLAILEQLATLRQHLDRLTVAAGFNAMRSPYYPARAMRPATETKAAACRARAEAQEAERQAQLQREALHAERGRAGWAVRGGA